MVPTPWSLRTQHKTKTGASRSTAQRRKTAHACGLNGDNKNLEQTNIELASRNRQGVKALASNVLSL